MSILHELFTERVRLTKRLEREVLVLIEKNSDLEAQVSKYKKFHGMYGFEKMEVARHVQLYKDYQEKFKRYHFKMEDKIESLEAKLIYQVNLNSELNKKIARYERDVTDDDVFLGGMIP